MIILVADRENDFSLRNKIEKAFQILDRYLYWFQTYATKKFFIEIFYVISRLRMQNFAIISILNVRSQTEFYY